MSSITTGPVKNTYFTSVIALADVDKSGTLSIEELNAFENTHKKDGYVSLIEPEAPDKTAQAKGLANATAMMLKEYELFQQVTTGGSGIGSEGISQLAANDLDKTTVSHRDIAKAKKALPPANEPSNPNDTRNDGYGDIYNNTNPYGPIYVPPMMNSLLDTSNLLVQQNAQFLETYQTPPPAATQVATAPTEPPKRKKFLGIF